MSTYKQDRLKRWVMLLSFVGKHRNYRNVASFADVSALYDLGSWSWKTQFSVQSPFPHLWTVILFWKSSPSCNAALLFVFFSRAWFHSCCLSEALYFKLEIKVPTVYAANYKYGWALHRNHITTATLNKGHSFKDPHTVY